MSSRIFIGLATVALGIAATGAQAGEHYRHHHGHDHDRYGRYARMEGRDRAFGRERYVAPAEQWRHERREYSRGPNGGMIIGGVVGAIIGHNVASDANRPVATLAGALIGAAIGSELGDDDHDHRGHGRR